MHQWCVVYTIYNNTLMFWCICPRCTFIFSVIHLTIHLKVMLALYLAYSKEVTYSLNYLLLLNFPEHIPGLTRFGLAANIASFIEDS